MTQDKEKTVSLWEIFEILLKGGDINDITSRINDKLNADNNEEEDNEVH